jgi:hypothetical protein
MDIEWIDGAGDRHLEHSSNEDEMTMTARSVQRQGGVICKVTRPSKVR